MFEEMRAIFDNLRVVLKKGKHDKALVTLEESIFEGVDEDLVTSVRSCLHTQSPRLRVQGDLQLASRLMLNSGCA